MRTSATARDPDQILRYAAVVFAVALIAHGADHLRRGTDVLPTAVLVAGNVQFVAAIGLAGVHVLRTRRQTVRPEPKPAA